MTVMGVTICAGAAPVDVLAEAAVLPRSCCNCAAVIICGTTAVAGVADRIPVPAAVANVRGLVLGETVVICGASDSMGEVGDANDRIVLVPSCGKSWARGMAGRRV